MALPCAVTSTRAYEPSSFVDRMCSRGLSGGWLPKTTRTPSGWSLPCCFRSHNTTVTYISANNAHEHHGWPRRKRQHNDCASECVKTDVAQSGDSSQRNVITSSRCGRGKSRKPCQETVQVARFSAANCFCSSSTFLAAKERMAKRSWSSEGGPAFDSLLGPNGLHAWQMADSALCLSLHKRCDYALIALI